MKNLRLFESAQSDPFDAMCKRFMAPTRMEWEISSPDIRLDVTEMDDIYRVHADLPGVKKDDIKVRVDGNIIQIDAEVKPPKDSKERAGKVLRRERWQGAVSRVLTLAQDVDESKVSAKYDEGVLTLELPKKAATASKRISIQ